MHQTGLEFYHEDSLLTRLLKQLVTAVSDKTDKLLMIPVFERRRPGKPECGGYNEAFIIQHWASYAPRD